VTSLAIDQPRIALLQSPAGEWNFSSLGTKPGGEPAATEAGPDAKPAGRPAAATEAGPGAKPAPRPAAVAEAPGNGSKLDLSVKLVRIADGEFTMGHAAAT